MPYFYYLILDLAVVVALTAFAFIILLRDKAAELNRMFAMFAISISIWILANYVSNDTELSPATSVFANYFVFVFSYAATITLLRFAIILANDTKAKYVFSTLYPGLLAIGATAATPLVVKGVALQDHVYAVNFGPGIALYGLCLLASMIATFAVIYKNMKRSTGDQKARLNILYRSLCWALPGTLIMQFILPTTTGWFGLTNIGVFPMIILIFGLYYGAVKHKMFDLRFFVVRAAMYILSAVVLSVLYIAPVVYIVGIVIMGFPLEGAKFVVAVMVGTAAAVNYERLRRWFDRVTSKVFFRDNYDSAALLGELNKRLVSNADLNSMLIKSAELIATNLKAEFCVFALNETAIAEQRFIGTETKRVSAKDMRQARNVRFATDTNLVVTDYLEEEQGELKAMLTKNNTAVLIRLSSNAVEREEGLGYILLGYKKSGNGYGSKDAQALEAMANVLTIAIENALRFEEIQKFNVTLQQRVEDATRQLRRTNAKLEALDESKDDFISMASHQLRTPLTAVKGYISMVLEGDAGDVTPLQKKMLGQAFMSSQRMVFLIADLLNVSRLKTGKFVIERTPVNLANMISEEIVQLHETAVGRSLRLTYEKPKDFPVLMLDETKSRQVIMNYIDNAIHYTKAGGHIRVELTDRPHSIELRVVDDGIGVPKSEQHHLFTKFYRALNARRQRPDGTGLGLFMAKKVIVAQGGAVIFDSRENHGSTFGFTIPKDKLLVRQEKE